MDECHWFNLSQGRSCSEQYQIDGCEKRRNSEMRKKLVSGNNFETKIFSYCKLIIWWVSYKQSILWKSYSKVVEIEKFYARASKHPSTIVWLKLELSQYDEIYSWKKCQSLLETDKCMTNWLLTSPFCDFIVASKKIDNNNNSFPLDPC